MTAKDTRDLLGGDKMFWNQIVGLVAQLCEFTKKNHEIVYFKRVNMLIISQ